MMDFIYWITGIIIAIILSYVTYKKVKKINDVKIQQEAEKLEDIKGADFQLKDGEDIHIKGMEISQKAKEMKNVTGLSFNAEGKQSARLQGVKIEQPNAQMTISDDPSVQVTINKQN